MKILKSYKKIAKSMLIEHAWDRKFGESLPTLEDVMNEEDVMSHVIKYKDEDGNEKEITVKSALQAGESHPAYKQASDIADKGQAGLAQKDKEEPAGKLGGGDFERDFDDSEPEGGEEPSGEPDDEEEREGWENVEYIKDTDYDDILDDPQSIWNAFDDMEQADIKVPGWMFDKAVDIRDGDGDENDAEELQRGLQNIYDRPEDFKESIKVINGKKYKPVKEEKKATKKHILRENYERFGGK